MNRFIYKANIQKSKHTHLLRSKNEEIKTENLVFQSLEQNLIFLIKSIYKELESCSIFKETSTVFGNIIA